MRKASTTRSCDAAIGNSRLTASMAASECACWRMLAASLRKPSSAPHFREASEPVASFSLPSTC
eukprot:403396-Prymnesium_polylepis.1